MTELSSCTARRRRKDFDLGSCDSSDSYRRVTLMSQSLQCLICEMQLIMPEEERLSVPSKLTPGWGKNEDLNLLGYATKIVFNPWY